MILKYRQKEVNPTGIMRLDPYKIVLIYKLKPVDPRMCGEFADWTG